MPELFAITNSKGEFLDPRDGFTWQKHASVQTAEWFKLEKALHVMRMMNRADVMLMRIPQRCKKENQ